ncbi:MAG: hypothetical protein HY661_16880 [Betaproteobacteria bacterium]|nr:hypothetical protein [Betaproteobacteria bacterium]
MGHVHKATPAKAARIRPSVFTKHGTASDPLKKPAKSRPRSAAKHEDPMTQGDRRRMMAAAPSFLADQYDFDYESEEQDMLEAEAEIARLLCRD